MIGREDSSEVGIVALARASVIFFFFCLSRMARAWVMTPSEFETPGNKARACREQHCPGVEIGRLRSRSQTASFRRGACGVGKKRKLESVVIKSELSPGVLPVKSRRDEQSKDWKMA